MSRNRGLAALLVVVGGFNANCGDSAASGDSRVAFDIAIVSGADQTDTVGQVLPIRFAVKVVNAAGKGVGSADVTFSSTKGGGSISDASAVVATDQSGVASVGLRLGTVAGVDSFSAVTAHLMPARIAALAVHDHPANLAITAGDHQHGTPGFPLPAVLALRLLDQFANPVVGTSIEWILPDSEGRLTPGGSETDADGRASAAWLLGLSIGQDTASATAIGQAIPTAHFAATSEAFTATLLSNGINGNCGIVASGDSYCWGSTGIPGPGKIPGLLVGGLKFTSISSSLEQSCGLTGLGVAYCWGGNSVGEVGDGTQETRQAPVLVSGSLVFSSLVAGWNHTCGVTTSNEAYCWGDNGSGELGDSTAFSKFVPTRVVGGISFQQVALGASFTCGLDTDGKAYCWGGSSGHNGPKAVSGGFHFTSIALTTQRACGLTDARLTYCWLNAAAPQLQPGGHLFSSIWQGGTQGCGIDAVGSAYCWGMNYAGQLGDGTKTAHPNPVAVAGGAKFTAISPGLGHTCGLATSGAVLCWGDGSNYQLGDGSTIGRTTPAGVPLPPGL